MASVETATPSHGHPVSDIEARHYYYGLYSKPNLVARTGNEKWEQPTGPESYLRPKELRTVGNHDLKGVWEDKLAPQIHAILESNGVKWTSTDVARIGYIGESAAPVVVWIGVQPGTLSREHGHTVAMACKTLLITNKIHDVEVEIRESVVTRYVGPPLEKPVDSHDPTAELLEPLTSALGLFICNLKTPDRQGTGGFYVTDDKSQLYLLTARHVVFSGESNAKYNRRSTSPPRINVQLLSSDAFNNYLKKIEQAILKKRIIIDYQEGRIETASEDWPGRDHAERILSEANQAIAAFQTLYDQVVKRWSDSKKRILGFVRFSPPIEIDVGAQGYTQDYALIQMDSGKIDSTNFTGNAIDLGTQIAPEDFTLLMYPNARNRHNFKYPNDRLLKIHGIISEHDMRNPTMLDATEKPCLIVIKRGFTTGLTLGRANEFRSFVRNYFDDIPPKTSREWAIYPYDGKSGPFSAAGDSGSAIVDCLGHLGGLLTGGGGLTDSTDITYATPAFFILESLEAQGFKVTIELPLTA